MSTTKSVRRSVAVVVASVLAGIAVLAGTGTAVADDGAPRTGIAINGSSIVSVTHVTGRQWDVQVKSRSMNRIIDLQVFRPANTSAPRPTLYLLNGASGGVDASSNWPDQTDMATFFTDKQVNVVVPRGGAYSYYTNWRRPDPILGTNQWITFLNNELPPLIDAALGTTRTQALAAISMAGSSALMLAADKPGFYKSVASYSGCATTSSPLGQAFVRLVVEGRGEGDTRNMWGPSNDPLWVRNDAVVNAYKLRGTKLYIAAGNGLPGPHDTLANKRLDGSQAALVNQIVLGGGIEAIINNCTHALADRLHQLRIPATIAFRSTGTHSWGYWQDDLHKSWPLIARSLNIPA